MSRCRVRRHRCRRRDVVLFFLGVRLFGVSRLLGGLELIQRFLIVTAFNGRRGIMLNKGIIGRGAKLGRWANINVIVYRPRSMNDKLGRLALRIQNECALVRCAHDNRRGARVAHIH
jgi:hypothetical protein